MTRPSLTLARETLRTELTEATGRRTWRGPTLLAAVLLTAVGSPLAARFMPELLASSLAGAGATLTLPDPTAADAWAQWVKNASSLLLVVLVIVVAASLAGKRASGVAAATLAGSRSRTAYVLAKAVAHLLVATGTTAAGTLVSALTIPLLLPSPGQVLRDGLVATALWLVWALDVLALTLLVSAVSRAAVLPVAVGMAASLLAPTLAYVDVLARWTPLGLTAAASTATTGASPHAAPVVTGIALAVVLAAGAALAFRRVEL